MDEKLKFELIRWGKKIHDKGYVVAKGGNISAKSGDLIYIKKSGVSMGELTVDDIITSDIRGPTPSGASIDYMIHREIYLNTDSRVVIHAHPEHVIAISIYLDDYFEPVDLESRFYLQKVPVVTGDHFSIYPEIGKRAIENNLIIEKNHGIYIHGAAFEKCFMLLELIEHAAKIYYLYETMER